MINIDPATVKSFGAEWSRFSQDKINDTELSRLFDDYFHIFPWHELPPQSEGFDMGCGSGRWAKLVAPLVGRLNCIDPSPEALQVAQHNLRDRKNATLILSGVSDCPIAAGSQDFGYSLGVLHHVPDTVAAMQDCVKLLKPGAPFLVYIYYRFDGRPRWYIWLWRLSNVVRFIVSRMPDRPKAAITEAIAALIYFPFAHMARIGERLGMKVDGWILSAYRQCSFYTMRTDARDRFGTPLEQRFTRGEIKAMMRDSGLENVRFSSRSPFWCALGTKKP